MTTTNKFTKRVQQALDGLHLDDNPDRDALRHLVQSLDKRRRNRILRAALASHFESEVLKPYQAELIKMQSYALRRFYMRPKQIRKQLFELRTISPKMLLYGLYGMAI